MHIVVYNASQFAQKHFIMVQKSFKGTSLLYMMEKNLLAHLCCKRKRLLIYACVKPINPLFLQEQAGFRHGRLTVDQLTLLTEDIEDSFLALEGRSCVQSHSRLQHYMALWSHLQALVHMLMELVGNQNFTFTTGNDKQQVTMP